VDLLTLVLGIAAVWFSYKLGQASVLWPIKKILQQMAESQGKTLEQLLEEELTDQSQPKTQETRLEIERVDGRYFAYAEGGEFLAQGQDFRGLMETMKQRFPNRDFRINKYQPQLTEEETGRLVASIFQVYGDKNDGKEPTNSEQK
jgi:hypothetical protein